MNTTTRKVITRTVLALSLCISSSTQSALAQSNCKEAKGILDEVFFIGGNSTSGTLSNGGWLNGTTLVVFTGAPSFPLPNVAVFAGQFTITTDHGQLKTSNAYLLDVAAQKGTVLGNIDPDGSTGIFAGATGTIFLNYTTINLAGNPQTFQSEVHGQVCFAKQ
jgi:hypothetical protein